MQIKNNKIIFDKNGMLEDSYTTADNRGEILGGKLYEYEDTTKTAEDLKRGIKSRGYPKTRGVVELPAPAKNIELIKQNGIYFYVENQTAGIYTAPGGIYSYKGILFYREDSIQYDTKLSYYYFMSKKHRDIFKKELKNSRIGYLSTTEKSQVKKLKSFKPISKGERYYLKKAYKTVKYVKRNKNLTDEKKEKIIKNVWKEWNYKGF